jgi:glyoxylate/hydroxypyruvate reductase A
MPTKSPVIIDLKFDQEQVAAALKGAFPDREVINLLHPASRNRDLSGIDYAVVWKPGAELFSGG